jgi:hypothetical protein
MNYQWNKCYSRCILKLLFYFDEANQQQKIFATEIIQFPNQSTVSVCRLNYRRRSLRLYDGAGVCRLQLGLSPIGTIMYCSPWDSRRQLLANTIRLCMGLSQATNYPTMAALVSKCTTYVWCDKVAWSAPAIISLTRHFYLPFHLTNCTDSNDEDNNTCFFIPVILGNRNILLTRQCFMNLGKQNLYLLCDVQRSIFQKNPCFL